MFWIINFFGLNFFHFFPCCSVFTFFTSVPPKLDLAVTQGRTEQAANDIPGLRGFLLLDFAAEQLFPPIFYLLGAASRLCLFAAVLMEHGASVLPAPGSSCHFHLPAKQLFAPDGAARQ